MTYVTNLAEHAHHGIALHAHPQARAAVDALVAEIERLRNSHASTIADPDNKVFSWAAAMDRCDELLKRAERAEAERDAANERADWATKAGANQARILKAERDELAEHSKHLAKLLLEADDATAEQSHSRLSLSSRRVGAMSDRESVFPDGPRKPPLFDGAIARTCTRRLGAHDCGKDAVRHVIWDEECENGFVCEKHLAELGMLWTFLAHHDVGPDCAMPGAMFFFEENVCRCEDELEPAAEFVEAVAVNV